MENDEITQGPQKFSHCTVGHLSMAVLVFQEIEIDTMYEHLLPGMNTAM